MTNKFKETPQNKIALLIDGDNAQSSLIEKILTEAGKYGSVTIRRIYGDWTKSTMSSWKNALNINAIQPIQQFRYTVGKNSTDSAMIIDAMDVLHSEQVDGFCLVSSDSDYTRLATRIREEGYFVLGIGRELTPKPFVNACNVFIYTENLVPPESVAKEKSVDKKKAGKKKRIDPIPLLKGAFDMAVQEDGWANLATMGFYLHQLDPGFDPRTYGFKQLNQLIRNYSSQFELKIHEEDGRRVVYVQAKE
jgi:uncharacterized protein (TIGR00288 family)